jgi:hypothetical protein
MKKTDTLEKMLDNAWEFRTWFNRDGTIRRISIDIRETTTNSATMKGVALDRCRQFVKERGEADQS